jgi:hypothetical protein
MKKENVADVPFNVITFLSMKGYLNVDKILKDLE